MRLLLLAAALVLAGCFTPPAEPYVEVCDDTSLGDQAAFADVQDHFTTYCTFCHDSSKTGADRRGAPEDVNYDTFEGATAMNFLTWARSVDGTMPPMGRMPSDDELLTLKQFLQCNAVLQIEQTGDDDDSAR